MQGDDHPARCAQRGDPLHPVGDRVNPVCAAVGSKNLGRGVTASARDGLKPEPAQRSGAVAPGHRLTGRQHRIDQAGRQQRPELPAGPRRSMTSRTRRSAASVNAAAWRIGADMASVAVAAGCSPRAGPPVRARRGRAGACDEGRHRSTVRLAGSYSTTGMTAKAARRGAAASGPILKWHSPTRNGANQQPTQRSGASARWRVADKLRAIIAQMTAARTRARRWPHQRLR